jgi:hypothetical protein
MGFDPEARTGVVVLMNAVSLAGGDDIGRHLLNPNAPLLPASSPALVQPKPHTEISLSPAIFDRYVGRYEFSPTAPLLITRDGDRFMAQLGAQPAVQIFAESEKEFFYRAVDAQLTFETDANGKVVAVVLRQNGLTPRAVRAN